MRLIPRYQYARALLLWAEESTNYRPPVQGWPPEIDETLLNALEELGRELGSVSLLKQVKDFRRFNNDLRTAQNVNENEDEAVRAGLDLHFDLPVLNQSVRNAFAWYGFKRFAFIVMSLFAALSLYKCSLR